MTGSHSLIFSPVSKRVAYYAKRGEKWFVVVDGVEGKEYDGYVKGSRIVFDSPTRFMFWYRATWKSSSSKSKSRNRHLDIGTARQAVSSL